MHGVSRRLDRRLNELEASLAAKPVKPVPVDPQKNRLVREAIAEVTARLLARDPFAGPPSAALFAATQKVTQMTNRRTGSAPNMRHGAHS
jgi:hypothetical protein